MSSRGLIKNTIIVMLGNLGTKLIMFVMVPLYAKWLSTSDYGIYDTMLSLASFLVPIITLQLEQSVFRMGIVNDSRKEIGFKNAFIYSLIISGCMSLFIIIYMKSTLAFFFGIYIILVSCQTIFIEYIRGQSKLQEYAISNISITFFVFVLNFVLIGKMHLGVKGLFLSYIVAYVAFCLQFVVKNKCLWRNKVNKEVLKEQIKFSLPLVPNTIGFWITNLSDRFLILFLLGANYNGVYAVAAKIPTILTTFYSAFVLAWQQEAILLLNSGKQNKIVSIMANVMKLLFSFIILLLPFLKYVFMFLFDESYHGAISISAILLLGTVYLCLSQFFSGILMAKNQTRLIGTSTVVAAIINFLINIVLLKYGLIIAAVSTAIAYFVMLLLRYKALYDVIKNHGLMIKIILYTIIYILFLPSTELYGNYVDIFWIIGAIFVFIILNFKKLWGRQYV